MEGKIALRVAARDDLASILAIQRASPGAAAWSADDYAAAFADDAALCLLAEDTLWERAAGFLVSRSVADEMEILNLAVADGYRRQGLGRRLVGEALARAQGRGARTCWLEVRAGNRTARLFYRALGFREESRRRRYYRDPEDDAVVCVRRLPPAGPPTTSRPGESAP